jgi:hypothetical protein
MELLFAKRTRSIGDGMNDISLLRIDGMMTTRTNLDALENPVLLPF